VDCFHVTTQQRAHLGFPEPAVASGCADAADAARRGPACHGLGIDPEESGDLSGGEQSLAAALHVLPFLTLVAETCPKCAGKRRFSPYVPENMRQNSDSMVTLDDIKAAARRLTGVAVRTPLVPYPHVPQRLLVKPESLQPTGSFKIRGAYAAISALPRAQRERGVIAHSSGNHAQAVAYAAAAVGGKAVVVVPRTAAAIKIESARSYGAQVVLVEPSIAARTAATEELANRHGYAVIPPFDDARVIAGQGTIGLEISADCPAAEVVLVPVSGGGLISGIAAAIAAASPGALVVGVEPELAADARDSLRAGRRIAWPASQTARTLADALRVEQVGVLPFAHLRAYVHDVVTVTEEEIRGAVRRIADDLRLIAEPGGAVAVAAYLYRRAELPAAATFVAVLSGGNIAPQLRAELLGG
jgi:threonine dehydratase